MTVLIAIPARYASTRYPGKPLVELNGPDGRKTLIRRSWEAAMAGKDRRNLAVMTPPLRPLAPQPGRLASSTIEDRPLSAR